MKSLFTWFVACYLCTLSAFAQHPDPNWASVKIPPLIFTEINWVYHTTYVEITNVGNEVIDLSNFILGNAINVAATKFDPATRYIGTMPKFYRQYVFQKGETLAPGKSLFFMRVSDLCLSPTQRDVTRHIEKNVQFGTHFTYVSDGPETKNYSYVNKPQFQAYAFDSVNVVNPHWELLHYNYPPLALMYRYERQVYDPALDKMVPKKDSLIADQFGLFDAGTNAGRFSAPSAIAGVPDANGGLYVLARKATVKMGNADWNISRGISADDSEWMVVPIPQGREPYTSAANHGNYTVDLSPKNNYSISGSVISVPWNSLRGDRLIIDGLTLGKGLSWQFDRSVNQADSAYSRVREGDQITFYAFGNVLTAKDYTFNVKDATADLAIAFPKIGKSGTTGFYAQNAWIAISDNNPVMDTISNIPYQTALDTLMKYVEIPPLATRSIIYVDGDNKRVEIKDGDLMRVVSQDKIKTKDYYIKVDKYAKSDNATLSAITFPDYSKDPDDYFWKWESLRLDTIPDFLPNKFNYTMMVSANRKTVPALIATAANRNARIVQTRAINLDGTLAQRTTTFKVIAESDTIVQTYSITFVAELDDEFVQPIIGEPFISEVVRGAQNNDSYIEIFNPTSEPMDMSNYRFVALNSGWTTETAALTGAFSVATAPINDDFRRIVVPGRVADLTKWANGERGFLKVDPAINTIVAPGDVFVMGHVNPTLPNEMKFIGQVDMNVWEPAATSTRKVDVGRANGYMLFKILNDSIKNGTKATNISVKDFQLVDMFLRTQVELTTKLNAMVFAGSPVNNRAWYWLRKARVQKGMLERAGGISEDIELADWIYKAQYSVNAPNLDTRDTRLDLGKHYMEPITSQFSTVTSSVYKVTPGYKGNLIIRGLIPGTTVTDFLANLNKADKDQTLVVSYAGKEKDGTALLGLGDILTVTAADKINTSNYSMKIGALNSDVSLQKVSGFNVNVNSDNTISGFGYNAKIADVLAGVVCNELSVITVVDSNNKLVPLNTIRYTQDLDLDENAILEQIETKVFDGLMFEVTAENGDKKLYSIKPDSGDLFITSNYFNVVEGTSRYIKGIPDGLSAPYLLSYLYAPNNATIKLYNKSHYERVDGLVKIDDYVKVTSADGTQSVKYSLYIVGEEVGAKIISSVKPELAGSSSKIYPNPATTILNIENAPVGSIIQVISISGSLVYTKQVSDILMTIPVSQLDKGLYFVRIVEREGATVHKMLKK